MWPPPEVEANPALQRLVQAQIISQKIKKPVQAGQSGNFFDSSSNRRQEKNVQKQRDPEQAATKSAGRVAQLVRSLLAARNTGPTRLDKESIEKLRVRGSKKCTLCRQRNVSLTTCPCVSCHDLLHHLTVSIRVSMYRWWICDSCWLFWTFPAAG